MTYSKVGYVIYFLHFSNIKIKVLVISIIREDKTMREGMKTMYVKYVRQYVLMDCIALNVMYTHV